MSEDLPALPWERSRKRAAPARVPLTRERIVEAAFVVLDRVGYDRLSMRQVATELGVAVSALYVHVESKRELLDLMYARLFEGFKLEHLGPERWQEGIRDWAFQTRAKLKEHRDMARISMGGVPFTPELIPYVERLVAVFRAIGLPDRIAASAGDVISTFIDGFAYEESMWMSERETTEGISWEPMREQLIAYFKALPADRFPNLVAISDIMLNEDNDQRFDIGIEIMIRGLASYLDDPPGGGEERADR
jgi:AcrR family transcriptional regulator